jgi:catechol-2,3-dioxygenase
MEIVHEASFAAFMTYDEEHHRLALIATPVRESAPPGAAGLDHVAYTFESMEELLGNYLRLKADGILPVWSINHGSTTSLYYADPDGNRVELQIENFETERDVQDSDQRAASMNGWPREAWTEVSRQFDSGLVLH